MVSGAVVTVPLIVPLSAPVQAVSLTVSRTFLTSCPLSLSLSGLRSYIVLIFSTNVVPLTVSLAFPSYYLCHCLVHTGHILSIYFISPVQLTLLSYCPLAMPPLTVSLPLPSYCPLSLLLSRFITHTLPTSSTYLLPHSHYLHTVHQLCPIYCLPPLLLFIREVVSSRDSLLKLSIETDHMDRPLKLTI